MLIDLFFNFVRIIFINLTSMEYIVVLFITFFSFQSVDLSLATELPTNKEIPTCPDLNNDQGVIPQIVFTERAVMIQDQPESFEEKSSPTSCCEQKLKRFLFKFG